MEISWWYILYVQYDMSISYNSVVTHKYAHRLRLLDLVLKLHCSAIRLWPFLCLFCGITMWKYGHLKISFFLKTETTKWCRTRLKPKWISPYPPPQLRYFNTANHTSVFKGFMLLHDSWHDCKKKGMCQVALPILSMAGFNILMCFITTVWAR